MHRSIFLRDNEQAQAFLEWLRKDLEWRKKQVKELRVARAVAVSIVADVLNSCKSLTALEIKFEYFPLPDATKNHLLEPMNKLEHLTRLSVTLAAVPHNNIVRLPDYAVFHYLTHLHISPTIPPLEVNPVGFSELDRLTNLSAPAALLRKGASAKSMKYFLNRVTTRVIVLWQTHYQFPADLVKTLVRTSLCDNRVVIFCHDLKHLYDKEEGGFWSWAERVVDWRQENISESFTTYFEESELTLAAFRHR